MTASFYESTFIQCSTETELASILKFKYKQIILLKNMFSLLLSLNEAALLCLQMKGDRVHLLYSILII